MEQSTYLIYADEDLELAEGIANEIRRMYFKCFLRHDILPGLTTINEIERAIESSACIVLVFSKNSANRNEFFNKEIKLALKARERIRDGEIFLIPAHIDNYHPEEWQDLKDLQYVDIDSKNISQGMVKILEALKLIRNSTKESSDSFVAPASHSRNELILRIVHGEDFALSYYYDAAIRFHTMILGGKLDYDGGKILYEFLGEKSEQLLQAGAENIRIGLDFDYVIRMNSGGIGYIIKIHKLINDLARTHQKINFEFTLYNVVHIVYESFHISYLTKVFPIHQTRDSFIIDYLTDNEPYRYVPKKR